MEYTRFRFGRLPKENHKAFMPLAAERKDVYFIETQTDRQWVHGFYLTPRSSSETVDALFASLQFERSRLSPRVHGTGEEAIADMTAQLADIRGRIAANRDEQQTYRVDVRDRLLRHYSHIRYLSDSFNLRRYAAHTEESFYLLGWVPEEEAEAFTQAIAGQGGMYITLIEDPATISGHTPPVRLRNNALFRPFEALVKLYGLPSYGEADPTPLMALTYTALFGVMFGDLGQGAVLFIVSLLLSRRMPALRIGCYLGVSSMAFGWCYNSVFGFEGILPHGPWTFPVLERTTDTLGYTLWIGAVFITAVMLINVVNAIRQRDIVKLLGPNGLFGLALYWEIVLLLLPFLGFTPSFLPGGILLGASALPILIIFLRVPIAKLLRRGRTEGHGQPLGEYLLESFFEMIEVLLSYVTNTISFMRVGAYAISHASMMMVVLLLAGHRNWVVIAAGNIIVMGLEGILVGIQVLRLEFNEMFGRFYNGGGRPYMPFMAGRDREL
jgi:V/A-type H+-transporting ATPase subunit I